VWSRDVEHSSRRERKAREITEPEKNEQTTVLKKQVTELQKQLMELQKKDQISVLTKRLVEL